jgi:hypothetical protein
LLYKKTRGNIALIRRRLFLTTIAILFAASIYASNLHFAAEARPNGALLSWHSVKNAVYYDIYVDNVFVIRLPSDKRNYELTDLQQKATYNIIIGARTASNDTLDSEAAKLTTTSWEGVYRWVNPTKNDNDGLMKELVAKVKLVTDEKYGQYNEIWTEMNGEWLKIFPFGELEGAYGWLDYDGESEMENTYRLNCERFNTSSFTPSKWKIDKIYLSKDKCGVDIITKAFGFQVETSTNYTFIIGADGKRVIEFRNEGTGIANKALFHNPEGPSNSPFVLIEE